MFSEMAMSVLEARYLRKDPATGKLLETPDDMLRRVATTVSNTKDQYDTYMAMMSTLDFLPNTPTLVNAGRKNGQLSACFVLPIEDSMDGIFNTLHDAAMIHKTGGGTGFSFSRLRSKGAPVYSTSGTSSGVVSFLKVYNEATNSVKQGGVRRGANMGILRVDHPDIMEFIMCKDDPNEINNFNLSVGIVDGFMEAVKKDKDWQLIDPAHKNITKIVKARDLWDMIIHQAWKNGEPGVVFLDVINKHNPTPELGEIEATNPCGEQPLLPYESCNLGSINLMHMVKDGAIDYFHLEEIVRASVDFLNGVLDHNTFPLEKIRRCTLKTRKIGLGVMGWADALIKMKIPYNSEEAINLAREIMIFINDTAHKYSIKQGYDNATLTTIAPTGTISMLANTSSGIEPNFSWVYMRRSMDKEFWVVHPLMEAELKRRQLYNDEVLQKIYLGTPLRQIPGLENFGDEWVLSHQISPEYHIRMQAAFQAGTDNAVSKTINLPNNATEVDVRHAYELAYQLGCKGITVYRDGCRANQVLNTSKSIQKTHDPSAMRERPVETSGTTRKIKIGCGKLYVTVNADENGEPIEVFTNTGKAGGCPAQSEGLARMISLALRYQIPMEAITKQLRGIRCMSTIRKEGCAVMSCPDAIGRALEKFIRNTQEPNVTISKDEVVADATKLCPECGAKMELSEGCVICHSCGYSKCG